MKTISVLRKPDLRNVLVAGLISAGLAMLLYALTIAPTFSWGDSADLAMRLVYNGDQSFVGSHRDYVLWRFLGKAAQYIPVEDAGLRANLFTAFWGAVTVGAVTTIVHVTSHSLLAAVAAAASLTVAHSFWLLSVIAEVYTFNTAMVFLAFACVSVWWEQDRQIWLFPAFFFAGLSLVHHATGLVLIASLLPVLLIRCSRISLVTASLSLLLFIIVSAPYWITVMPRLTSNMGFLEALGLRMSQNTFFEVSVPREALKFIAYLTFNFIGLGIFLGLVGLKKAVDQRQWSISPPMFWAAAFIFAGLTSSIPDKFNVYVLVYPSFAILVGGGVACFTKRFSLGLRGQFLIVFLIAFFPPVGYAVAVKTSELLNLDLVGARFVPLRDNNLYFLWPPKNSDYGARVFAEQSLSELPQRAILIADYTLWRPLYFVQAVDSVRPDVEIVFVERLLPQGADFWISNQSCERRVFLATNEPARYYQLDRIQSRFRVALVGSLFEVQRECG